MRERVRVLHDPREQDRRDVGIDLDAQVGHEQRDHLAGRGRIGVHPGDRGLATVVRDVVVDVHDRRARQPLGTVARDRPGA